MLFTLTHELVHYIKDWSPAKYKVLADFVLGEFAKEGELETVVNKKIKELKGISGYYKNLNAAKLREAALEEVVAEACQRMLTESDAIERLAELHNRDNGLFYKVKSFIANFFNRVVQRYKNLTPQGYEAKLVDSIPDMAERMKVLFSDALVTAAENQRIVGEKTGVAAKFQAKQSNDNAIEDREFSYNELISKGVLRGSVVLKSTQLKYRPDGTVDVAWIREQVRTQCEEIQGHYFVSVADIDRKVEIVRDGIDHGIVRRNKPYRNGNMPNVPIVNARATLNLVDTLKNSIEVNRQEVRGNKDVEFVRVMLGVTGHQNSDGTIDYFAVRMQVEERKNRLPVLTEVEVLGVLTAANAKKIDSANARTENDSPTLHDSSLFNYNIADLLNEVKDIFTDTFSEDVYNHYNMQRKSNDFSKTLKFQHKSLDALSDSELLARHLEENSEAVGEILRRTADIEINPRVLNLLVNKKLKEYGISKEGREQVASVVPLLMDSAKINAVKGGDITADLTSAIAEAVRNTDYTENLHAEDKAAVVEALKDFKGRVYLNEAQAKHLLNNGYTFQSFRQSLFGKLNVVKESANSKTSETPFTEVYLHLSEQFPNLFVTRNNNYSDKAVDESEYALDLIEKLDSLSEEHQLRIEDVFGSDADEVATHIMSELVADVVQKKYSSRKNPYVADVVEKLRVQRDKAVKKTREKAKESRQKAREKHKTTEMRNKVNEKGHPVCPNGKEFHFLYTQAVKNNKYGRREEVYQCEDCSNCSHKENCTKAEGNRTIRLNEELTSYHQEVLNNLNSTKGALLRMNRSIQAEGAFGTIKWNRDYKRARRRGLKGVIFEIAMISCGFNLHKYHLKKLSNQLAA